MDIGQLRTLVSVAELGSLNKAAERLRIAQPALSRQVRLLEAELGVALFERHGRGMIPTPAGLKVLSRAVRIMDELGSIRSDVDQEKHAGEIVLGIPSNIATLLTLPIVRSFSVKHPRTKLKIVSAFSGYLAEWLQKQEIHLSVMYEQDRTNTFRLERLLSDRVYAIGCPELMHGIDGPVQLNELTGRPLILSSARQHIRHVLDSAASTREASLEVRFEADDFHTVRDLTLAGLGISVLPPIAFEEHIEAGTLVGVPIVEEIRRNLVLAHLIDLPPSAIARDLGRIISESALQLVREGRWIGHIRDGE